MSVEINFVNIERNQILEDQVNDKLDRLFNKYDWITNSAVFLKEEKHPEGKNYKCEIRLSVPGPQLFAQEADTNFHKAINGTINDLGIQLEKKKDLMQEKR